jgi:hypothetical protein
MPVTVTKLVGFDTKGQAPGKMEALTPPSPGACHVDCRPKAARSQAKQ